MDYDRDSLFVIIAHQWRLPGQQTPKMVARLPVARIISLFRLNGRAPVINTMTTSYTNKCVLNADELASVPMFVITCMVCNQSTYGCCIKEVGDGIISDSARKYYKCFGTCQRSPVRL